MIPTEITLYHVVTVEPETRRGLGLGLALILAGAVGVFIARRK